MHRPFHNHLKGMGWPVLVIIASIMVISHSAGTPASGRGEDRASSTPKNEVNMERSELLIAASAAYTALRLTHPDASADSLAVLATREGVRLVREVANRAGMNSSGAAYYDGTIAPTRAPRSCEEAEGK